MQKTAIVTGGGTGIDRATAEKLMAIGHHVVCCGLDRDDDLPSQMEFVRLDVTYADAVAALASGFSAVLALFKRAGMILHDAREFTPDGFRKVMHVNPVGTQLVTTAFRPALAAAKGSVVNLASVWSFFDSPRNPAHAASKGAVVQRTRSHAVAFATSASTRSLPGWIDTRLAAGARNNPERNAAILARLPLGRWGAPADVADVIAFLLSDDARYVTGAVLTVDGGYGIV